MSHPSSASSTHTVGLVAGWGRYPFAVAEALKAQGLRVAALGVKDHCDPALAKICDAFEWVGMARMGQAFRFMKRNGVTKATMAGKIFKVKLYERGAWWRHLPDWTALRVFWPHFVSGRRDRKDDTLLKAIVDAYADAGITFGPATDYAPELLVKTGQLTKLAPTKSQWRDIAFGWNLAKEMGRLDIGQSVVVKDQTAIAIEAIEGTDECIRRAGKLCTSGGFSVVKTAKPQQDMRFDVPTIGLGTLQTMLDAGGKVLAVEAGKTILVEEQAFLEFADAKGLVVVSIDQPPSE